MKQIWKFLTSLRLTAVLLALGIVLVFVGTVAQADEGLYQAQARYFKHWWVFGISFWGHQVPLPLPGGYLIGTALLINLIAAHIQRFQWTWKKAGIHLTHLGVILLLVGQLTTDIFSYETQLRFVEGQSKCYSESYRDYELAFVADGGDGSEDVTVVPQGLLAKVGEISSPGLPVTIRVKSYWNNTDLPAFRAPMQQNGPPMAANGVAKQFDFRSVPDSKTMDGKNIPTALVEFVSANRESLGTWVVSGWTDDENMLTYYTQKYAEVAGPAMAKTIVGKLSESQVIQTGGKTYTISLRPVRVYTPFTLTLLKATHTTYPGRPDLPKDFRSRVRLQNPETSENREVEIYMNTPLRYAGLTFYQFQMAAGEMAQEAGRTPSSTLQVVRNPSWLTPYGGCIIVAVGLITQFMIHLVGFMRKRMTA